MIGITNEQLRAAISLANKKIAVKRDARVKAIRESLQGVPGEQGMQGPQGEQGLTGEKGERGDTGPQGLQGPAGRDGIDGAAGIDGKRGPQGAQGIQGDQGPQGIAGPKGLDGSPDTAHDIRTKLESLPPSERLDARFIKNLPQSRTVFKGGGALSALADHVTIDKFVATAGQTTFLSTKPMVKTLYFSINGATQTPTTDYTETAAKVTLTAATYPNGLPGNDQVEWCYIQ